MCGGIYMKGERNQVTEQANKPKKYKSNKHIDEQKDRQEDRKKKCTNMKINE